MFGINHKLVDSKQNRFTSDSVLTSFQENAETDEIINNTEHFWSHSQKITLLETRNIEYLKSKKSPAEMNSYHIIDIKAIASVTRSGQKKLDKVLPVLRSFQIHRLN